MKRFILRIGFILIFCLYSYEQVHAAKGDAGNEAATCTDTYEPNDSSFNAYGPLTSGSTYTAKICSSTDNDYFKINVSSMGTIEVTLSVPPDKDYDLVLYNSSRETVDSSYNEAGSKEIINYTASKPGIYYIRVYSYMGEFDEIQTYELSGTWPSIGVPKLINYQGILMDKDGKPLPDGPYNLSFNIYTSATPGGTPVWESQTFSNTPVVKGYFNVLLGLDKFQRSIINAFGSDTAYIEIVVNNKTILPRQQINSIPYVEFANAVTGPVYAKPISIKDNEGNTRVSMEVNSEGSGTIEIKDDNGNAGVSLTNLPGTSTHGSIEIRNEAGAVTTGMNVDSSGQGSVFVKDKQGNLRGSMGVLNYGTGFLETMGPNGNRNIRIHNTELWIWANPNLGGIDVNDANGKPKVKIISMSGNYKEGVILTLGPSNKENVSIFYEGIYINSNKASIRNTGEVVADVKNFRMANSNRKGTEIQYACVEGPEAGAYIRGTAWLVKGRSVVRFPSHFMAVSNPKNMTVRLTPLSAMSKGLAVVKKYQNGFAVNELFNGTGTYYFDYLAIAVRKGYENYQVIRPVSNSSDMQSKEGQIQ